MRVLLKSNADVEKETKFGNTALHLACMEKWLVIGMYVLYFFKTPFDFFFRINLCEGISLVLR